MSIKRVNEESVVVLCGACGDAFTIPFTAAQEKAWRAGGLIQRVAPKLEKEDRELLISGTCDVCFEEMFSEGEE